MSIRINLPGWLVLICCLVPLVNQAQSLQKITHLDKSLKEISGLVELNDSLLAAINDSGNKPEVYLLSHTGIVLKKIHILGAKNVDWEDLTLDDQGMLYIGDFGNNLNWRRDLCLYRISVDSLLRFDSIPSTALSFRYADQQDFPPPADQLHFDCEAMFFQQGMIGLISKCRSEPFSGKAKIYLLNPSLPDQTLTPVAELSLPGRSFRKDAVTGAALWNGQLYVLTYSALYTFVLKPEGYVKQDRFRFLSWTQKEAIAVKHQRIWIADERLKGVNGGNLYQLK